MKKRILTVLLSFCVMVGSVNCPAKVQAESGNADTTIAADTGMVTATDTGTATDNYVGLDAEYHTQEQIKEYYEAHPISDMEAEFSVQPSVTEPYALGALTEETKQDALNMLNLLRYIAGVPAVSITEQAQNYAQAAALVTAINRKLSHVAERPQGMEKELYDLAVYGTFNSNLAAGGNQLCNAVVRYMLETNGDTAGFGHRRQLLDYYYTEAGFGLAQSVSGGYYSSVFVDANLKEDKIIAYPGQNQPMEYFGPGYAWTVIVPETVDESRVHVKLTDTKTGEIWDFASGQKDFWMDKSSRSACLIFSPSSIDYRVGDKYRVEITGINKPISYEVNLFQLGDFVPLEAIHSSIKAYSPVVGETHYRCTVQFVPENATNKIVTWTSSNPDVAEPEWAGNGVCKVVAKSPGSAVFTATSEDGGHTESIEINVKPKANSITLDKTDVTIGVGQSFELYGKAFAGEEVSSVYYKSDYDKNIIQTERTTTLSKIKVTGKAVGQTTITAYAYSNRDVLAYCKVNVVEPVLTEKLSLDIVETELMSKESIQLNPTFSPSNVTCKEIQWKSDNINVAKVQDGKVTATGNSLGKAVITAKVLDGSNQTAECTVTVYGQYAKMEAPVVQSSSSDKVVLKSISGCEYSMDGQEWQDSNTFTNLEPDHEYTFYIRKKAAGYMKAGEASQGTTVKTGTGIAAKCKHTNTVTRNASEATCTQKGYTGDTYCEDCKEKVSAGKVVAVLGHDYEEKITKKPSVSQEGVMTYTCTRCGDSYTEKVPKLSDASDTGKKDPTGDNPDEESPTAGNTAENDFVIKGGILKSYRGKNKSVVIPKGVTEIGARAFSQNRTIEKITIPNSVKKIGNYAFDGCGKLKSLTIPGSVKTIGISAFGSCAFKKVVVPEGVKKMGSMVFIACEKLESVTLPGSLKKIPSQAFAHSAKLKKVVIKKGCTAIGDHAFWYCINLKKLTLPKGVKKIGERAFLDTGIQKITLPKSVAKIDNKLGIFGFHERSQTLREITILNPKLKLDNMLGIAMPKGIAMTYGLPMQKSITIKGHKNSTARKFVSYINTHKAKYKKSARFVSL